MAEMSEIGEGPFNTSIAGQMADHRRKRRRALGEDGSTDDIVRHPMPIEKPHPAAQWDEAAGRWEIWIDEEDAWVALDDGEVQAPATPSAAAHPDALPPDIDLTRYDAAEPAQQVEPTEPAEPANSAG